MADNNDTKLLALDPDNAWGLNMVNAQYAKEASVINQSLQNLMDQLAQSVAFGAKALYGVGTAILLSSVCEAASNVMGSGSALYAGRESGVVEKDSQTELDSLKKESDKIAEQLKNPDLKPIEKNDLLTKKDGIKSKQDRLYNKIQSSHTKAQAKMNALQMMATGLGAFPKGIQDSLQQKGQANKGCYDAVERQAGSAYDTQKSILKGFLDIDYFAGLVTISNIQLK